MSCTGYFRCVVRPPQRPGCISPSPTAALRILISNPLRIRIQHPAAPRERVGPSSLRIGRLLRCADSLSSTLRPTEDAVRCSICQQRLHLPTGPTFWGDFAATITAGRAIAVEAPLTTQHAQERVEILSQGRARTRALSLGRAPTALP